MKMLIAALVLVTSSIVAGQRPSFAGTRPIGFPETPNITTTTPDPLADRFGEGTTERLPIEANGDRDLIDRLSKLPIDKQPFWLINWRELEKHRQQPQTYPQRPNAFVDPISSNVNNRFSSSNPGFTGTEPNGVFNRFDTINVTTQPGNVSPSSNFQNNVSLNPGGNVYPNPNSYPNPNAFPNSNVYPNSNTYPNSNVYPNPNVNPNSNIYPNSNVYPNTNVNPNTNIYPNPNPYPNPNAYPNSNVNLNTNVYPNSNVYPNVNGTPNSNIYPNNNGNPSTNVYPNSNVYPNVNSNPNSSIYPNNNGNPSTNVYPNDFHTANFNTHKNIETITNKTGTFLQTTQKYQWNTAFATTNLTNTTKKVYPQY